MPYRATRTAALVPAIVLALCAALFLAACSSSEEKTDAGTTHESTVSMEPAGFNADDRAFATDMIPHHEQAIELSALVPERSTNPELIALANQITAAQQPEINALRVFLVQWDENPEDNADGSDGSASHGAGGHHGQMQGMVDDATMAKLQSLSGPEFDKLWLQSMISHHQGAIEMAKAEVANGLNVDVKRMAQSIIDSQQAEITQMNQMLKGGQ
jgi:uncharacterized protein (DUF305 family)